MNYLFFLFSYTSPANLSFLHQNILRHHIITIILCCFHWQLKIHILFNYCKLTFFCTFPLTIKNHRKKIVKSPNKTWTLLFDPPIHPRINIYIIPPSNFKHVSQFKLIIYTKQNMNIFTTHYTSILPRLFPLSLCHS